jgi:hypothetical protein
MAIPIIPILTAVVGTIARAKGPAAKARAAGAAGVVIAAGQPIVDAFMTGFSQGALPQVEQLGVIVGTAVAGWIVGYAMVWLSPANKPKD